MGAYYTVYREECPYCHGTIYTSKLPGKMVSYPKTRYGNPYVKCPHCQKSYFDKRVKEIANDIIDDINPEELSRIVNSPSYIYEYSKALFESTKVKKRLVMTYEGFQRKELTKYARADLQDAINSQKDKKTIRELKKRVKAAEQSEKVFESGEAPINRILFSERDEAIESMDDPLTIAESFLRLNDFKHAKRLKEAGHDISDAFLREVYYCPKCKSIVGRETGGDKYCSKCNSKLNPTGIHVYEWKEYDSEKKLKVEKTWGWNVKQTKQK